MPITADRNGNVVTIAVTFDGGFILNTPGASALGRRLLILQTAQQMLADAQTALQQSDAQIDAQAAAAAAAITGTKASRPTGSL